MCILDFVCLPHLHCSLRRQVYTLHTTPPRAHRAYACTVASAASGAISSVRLARTLSPAASSSLPFVSGTHTKAKAKKAALSAA